MTNPDDQFDELMRRALANEADQVEPTDSLHEIQSRVRSQRKVGTRRPWMIAAGAAVVGTAAAIGAFSMLGDDARTTGEPPAAGLPAGTTSSTSAGPSTGPSPTVAPSELPTDQPSATSKQRSTPEPSVRAKAISVYWVGKSLGNDTGVGMRLYRTFVPISGQPALEGVQMLSTGKTDDPDYSSLWLNSTPSSVTLADGLVTVDFKQLPREKLDAGMANLAVQQLVYTVQGALGDESQQVRVTEQGRSSGALFGQIDTRQPFSRAQAADVQALVWITSPAEGTTVREPLTVDGIAATFEAVVNWRATNTKTSRVIQGQAKTKQGQGFFPFTFSAKLDPGRWQVEAYLISPKDGRITDLDSKTVVVR